MTDSDEKVYEACFAFVKASIVEEVPVLITQEQLDDKLTSCKVENSRKRRSKLISNNRLSS